MKKVVLLAGAIAAGMAIAPQAANAAAPELNDVQEVNLTDQEISAAITTANNQIAVLEGIKATTGYAAAVDAADQTAINYAINDLKALIEQMDMVIDGNILTNSDYFRNTSGIGYSQGDLRVDPSAAGTPDYIKRYAGAGLVQGTSTCKDVVDAAIAAVASNVAAAQAALAAHMGTMTPAEILDANATTAGNVDKTDLENILEEALDILGAYDTNYQDPAGDKSDIYDADIYGGKDGAINTKFDATVKGQIEAAKQLLERIEAAKNKDLTVDDTLDDQLLNQFELQTDVNVLTPLLEGYVVTFKIEANHVAAENVKDALTTELGKLEHHKACKHTDTHKVADEIQNVIDQLDPDAAWDAELDLHVRANSNPLAVQAWEAHLNGTSIAEVTGLYKKALGWDVTDLAEAIDAFQDRFNALDDCDVKTSIGTFLWSGTAVPGTVAKEFNDLKTEIMALGATVTPAQFAALDQRVTDLYDRLANVEDAWEDLAKLNADDVDLQKEITDAAGKDGYTSTAIKNKWETEEQPELDNLEKDINDALIAITKDAEFVGYNHFKPTVDLEKDHHKWLAEYQQANYDAAHDLRVAINLRSMELNSVENYKFTSNENQETTDDNLNVAFKDIKGEKDTSKFIYMEKYFNELDAHIGNNNGTLEGTDAVKHGDDLRYDRVNDWYDKGLAEYIGTTAYAAGWAEAAHAGKKIENTTPGVESVLTTEAVAKENVIFGWLQQEIQAAYKGIVENENANKILHDQIDDCQDYVDAAQKDIDDYAKFTLSHLEQALEVYPTLVIDPLDDVHDLAARKSSTVYRGDDSWDLDILYPGTTSGVPSLDPVALPAEYKTKEDATVITLAAGAHDYNNDFNCGHENGVWGWTKIATEITALWNLEKQEYDKVASKALLDAKTVENKITEIEENVDDIKNEAYTRIIKNGFARVHNSINEARAWAAALDGVCHEDASKPCSEADVKNNPCGWDDPEASKALADLIDFYNEKLNLLGTEHKDEKNDDHETPVVNEDNIKEFADYLNQMYVDLNAWTVKFAAADMKHKVALIAALDLAEKEAHTIEHYYYDAKHDQAAFTAADQAAAELWAKDFGTRKFPFIDGNEYTFQQILAKLSTDIAAAHTHHDPVLADDKYAGLEDVIANGIDSFDDYIKATEFVEQLCKDYAGALYDLHSYTELKTFADGLAKFNWESDYMKKVEANKDAYLAEVTFIETLVSVAESIVLGDEELYGDEFTGVHTNPTTKKELADALAAINSFVPGAEGSISKLIDKAEEAHLAGKADVFAMDTTENGFQAMSSAIGEAIDALKADLAAAKVLYADNAAAKAKYEAELAQVKSELAAFASEVEAEIANGNIYVKSEVVTAPKNNETVKAAVQDVTTALANEADHITNGFNAGVLAYDGAEDATDAKDNKTEVEKHLAADRDLLKAARTALVEAQALYAQNVEAKLEKQAQLENLKRDLNEFYVADGTVYSTASYIGEKTNWTKEAIEGVITTQKDNVTEALKDLDKAFNAGTAPAFVVPADVAPALDKAIKDLEDAKKYYADNVAAKDRLLLEVAAVLEANGLVKVDLENTAMYAADKALITNAEGTGLEEQFLAAVAVEKGNPAATAADEKLGHFGVEFSKGTIAANEATEMLHVQDLIAQNAAIAEAILKAANHYAEEHALFNEYSEKVNNLETLRDALTTTVWAVYDDIDLNKDGAALRAEVQAINEAILAERQALKSDVEVGTVKDHAADYVDAATGEDVVGHDNAIDAIETAIQTLEEHIAEYEKFYADEHAEANKYNDKVNNLETLRDALTTTVWAVYDDIENGKDGAALNAEVHAITEAIAAERAALETDLTEGNVQAHAADYVDAVTGEDVVGHDNAIDAIETAIQTLEEHIADYEKFYADEHVLAGKYNDELNNLETLRDALGTVWDAYETLDDSDRTLSALHNDWQAITEALAAERAAVEADLEAGNVQAHATTNYTVEEDGVTVEKKAHETAISDIADAIKTLQDKVRDIEEFKATNDKNYASLVEATKDLLASLEDVKYVSDDVYELLPATEAAADLDQESIEAARKAAESLATAELTALETALAEGKLYTEAEVAAQQAKIDKIADALEELKEQVKDAEDFRRANAEANDKLEEKVQALVTIINTAKANSVCDLCNGEDTDDLEAELDAVYEILDNVAESFAVGHLAMPMVTDNYAKYMQDLGAVEANVQATLDEIAEHKIRQINDQNAYNVLQKALVDVDLALADVQTVEGWENFAVRGAHADSDAAHTGATSNPDVKYLNELTDAVTDLKQLIEAQHAHEGVEDAALLGDKVGLGHVCEENKIDDLKAMKAIVADVKALIEAIHANEAAHEALMDRFDDLYADALDAYNFWHTYYTEYSTLTDNWYTANKGWVEEYNGELEPGEYLDMLKDMLHDSYVHGAAAYDWTVEAKGEELNDKANTTFAGYDADLAADRNDLAHKEALNHYNAVRFYVDYEAGMLRGEYDNYDYWTDTWTKDPFTADVMDSFLDEVEGEFGIYASLNTYLQDIEAAFAEGVMEDAINIDERNHALGIHQQLGGVKAVFDGLLAEYKDLFEEAHHLTNGKKIYSDQEYFTLGFFKKANDGSVENGQEMFKEVKVLVNDDIRLYDSRAYVWNEMGTPDDWSDDEVVLDEKGRVVYDKENNPGEIAEVTVLTVGQKSNELSFNFHQNPMALERTTLKAGTAEVDFLPGSISVKNDNIDTWVVKHTVSIDGIDVLAPEVSEMEITPWANSNKLIVRIDNPIDLTYTINSLVARTDNGVEFSYADRVLNYAAGQIEFNLPEGTTSVEFPEGFFTFRTGENSIARSTAMTVAVGGIATSIDALVAMGEKAEIFDLQGRRVKAESLISGNTYVVNGEKVMVK